MVDMASPEKERLEIGHVLFIDLVGYSKLLIEEQKERLHQLVEVVLQTPQVREATDEQLVRLPTGDGMALVFRKNGGRKRRAAHSRLRARSRVIRDSGEDGDSQRAGK